MGIMRKFLSMLLLLSLTYLMVEATTPCGPDHCELSCEEGKVCKDKTPQQICIPQKRLGKEDVCCEKYSCSDKKDSETTKGATGTGFRLDFFAPVILLCGWIVL